jgi:hypothetical protein
MSIRATSPFPVYLDADGTPLTGGYVYFGTSGANPETTPQAVYWDEALSIPAAQPIRTLNGFLVRNGAPSPVYMANVYSCTVRNRNRVLVSSALTNPGIPVSVAMTPVCSAATLAAGLTAFGFSAFVQTLLNDPDAATFLTTLGVSAFIQTLLDDADAATARATLGVDAVATVTATPYAPAAFNKSLTVIDCNMAAPLAADISAGATAVGQRVIIINRNTGTVTLTVTAGAATVSLPTGASVVLAWDGAAWHKIGGSVARWVLTNGVAQPWVSPWHAATKVSATGGGGAGGGGGATHQAGGGGGGGGTAIKTYALTAGLSCTYTVGGAGVSSTFTDGTTQITGSAGAAGVANAQSASGGAGGAASNGDLNIPGQGGGAGFNDGSDTYGIGGAGGSSHFGSGTRGVSLGNVAGVAGGLYGGGGGGVCYKDAAVAGGAGAAGVVIIEA